MTKIAKRIDVFARIGDRCKKLERPGLEQPLPPELPDISLSADNDPRAAFKPTLKLNTLNFHAELKKLKNKFQKYLREYAPEQKRTCNRICVTEFCWRKETLKDRKDFCGYTIAGQGAWEMVQIPHYGPPVGKAVTYYRAEIKLDSMPAEKVSFICFKGIDYKADVFMNGYLLGSHEGFFAPFEFDFTAIRKTGKNVLLIRVENDAVCMGQQNEDNTFAEGDKIYAATGCGWDEPEYGWHHCPPGMGIYQEVFIETREQLHLGDIFVRPILKEQKAQATVEVKNGQCNVKEIDLRVSVYGLNFKKTVLQNVKFEPVTTHIPGIGDIHKSEDGHSFVLSCGPGVNYMKFDFAIPRARLWSIQQPWLYQIQIELLDKSGNVFDRAKRNFGMREFHLDESCTPKGKFYLNGTPLKLRGTNTMGHLQQCVIKKNFDQLVEDILIARLANINIYRLTQCPVQEEIYDYCDKLGMMTQTDLPLFACLRRNKFCDALAQAGEMERLVRSHPCNVLISLINEPLPNGMSKPHRYLDTREMRLFFDAASAVIRQNNPDRAIKFVDGDYDPPSPGLPDNHCYSGWYTGHGVDLGQLNKGYWLPVKKEWNYACGEFGAEALDCIALMRRRYPEKWLPKTSHEERQWNPDIIPQSQTGRFQYMWFERPESLRGWVDASREHQEWVIRMMTQAYRRDNRMQSFALHLLIDAFPSGWMKAVMDCERHPKPAYFAYRQALCPLMVHFRSDRFSFFPGEEIKLEAWVCNDLNETFDKCRLHYQIEHDNEILFSGKNSAVIPALRGTFQGFLKFTLPQFEKRTNLLARIGLLDNKGRVLNDNAISLEIIPAVFSRPASINKAFIVGADTGKASLLAKKLGLKRACDGIETHSLILIDDFRLFKKIEDQVCKKVRAGALAVLLDVPLGEHTVFESKIKVVECSLGPRHFVSRKTAHPLINDFHKKDFFFWYDDLCGCVTPFLHSTFTADNFSTILGSGEGQWLENWAPTMAAAEQQIGKGVLRICQLELANRIDHNPAAHKFARKLLGMDCT